MSQAKAKEKTGIERIAAERARQIAKEGWTPEHDDHHLDGGLAMAAACYAAPRRIYVRKDYANGTRYDDPWPWHPGSDKRPYNRTVLIDPTPQQSIRLLEKAGALIAAEIDRLLRRDESST